MTHGFRGDSAPLIAEGPLTAVYDEAVPVELASSRVRDILSRTGLLGLLNGANELLPEQQIEQIDYPAPIPQSPTVTEDTVWYSPNSDRKDQ